MNPLLNNISFGGFSIDTLTDSQYDSFLTALDRLQTWKKCRAMYNDMTLHTFAGLFITWFDVN